MTREFLLHRFEYDREQGVLIWRNPPSEKHSYLIGKKVGAKHTNGRVTYRETKINGKFYSIHSLIWFIEFDELGVEIDHIDGDGLNNRIVNLRKTTKRLNQTNRHTHRSGRLVGTTYIHRLKKWQSRIQVNGQSKILGYFETEIQAHRAYMTELRHV